MDKIRLRPPFLLHVISICFILAALSNLFGVVQVVKSWNWLRVAGYNPFPLSLVIANSVLTLVFLVSATTLWLQISWAAWFGGISILISTVWFWFNRLVLAVNPLSFKEHLFSMFLTAIVLILGLVSLYLLQPYMGRRTENPGVINEQLPG